jgi:hypothetical protein
MVDRKIKQYLDIRSENPLEVIRSVLSFICNTKQNYKCIIVQSGFGFMNNDIPFTMIVESEDDAHSTFRITYNGWPVFEIEDTDDGWRITDEWSLCTQNDKKLVPDWENKNPKEILDKLFYYDYKEKSVILPTMKQMMFDMLREIYCDTIDSDEFKPDVYESRVALIYAEPYNDDKE